jgi:hypothetical protein
MAAYFANVHQMVHQMAFFEEAVRVPLVLRIPGVTEMGTARNPFAGLLYDLVNDPHASVDLIDDPRSADVCRELDESLCRDWITPDLSGVPKRRGDTRPGQCLCNEEGNQCQ